MIRHLKNLLLVASFILVTSAICLAQPKSESPTRVPSVVNPLLAEQRRLLNAQIKKEEAEYENLRVQTQKLKEKPEEKSSWDKLAENPATIVGVVGALAAAAVAFTSFIFNYRATLWNQRDTQFYEALERFGDKDSPAVRASAAGLLSEIGQKRWKTLAFWGGSTKNSPSAVKSSFIQSTGSFFDGIQVWSKLKHIRIIKSYQPYLVTTVNQLLTGMILEDNPIVLISIREALLQVSSFAPLEIINRLSKDNRDLQEKLIYTIADFCLLMGAKPAEEDYDEEWGNWEPYYDRSIIEDIGEGIWSVVVATSGFNRRTLSGFIEGDSENHNKFISRFRTREPLLKNKEFKEASDQRDTIVRNIEIASKKMRENIVAWSYILRNHNNFGKKRLCTRLFLCDSDLSKVNFIEYKLDSANFDNANLSDAILKNSSFKNANLNNAKLSRANLIEVNLSSCDLRFAKIDEAKMFSAKIDGNTQLFGVAWWKADYYNEEKSQIDEKLLEELFNRDEGIKVKEEHIHESARNFLMNKQKERDEKLASRHAEESSDESIVQLPTESQN